MFVRDAVVYVVFITNDSMRLIMGQYGLVWFSFSCLVQLFFTIFFQESDCGENLIINEIMCGERRSNPKGSISRNQRIHTTMITRPIMCSC